MTEFHPGEADLRALRDPVARELAERFIESELTMAESRLVQLRELRRALDHAAQPEPASAASVGR